MTRARLRDLAIGLALIAALTIAPAAHADAALTPGKSCKGSTTIAGKCIAPRPPVKPVR